MLLLAEGSGGLLGLDVSAEAQVPGGGNLVGDMVDRMCGTGLPVVGLWRLGVWDAYETICMKVPERGKGLAND